MTSDSLESDKTERRLGRLLSLDSPAARQPFHNPTTSERPGGICLQEEQEEKDAVLKLGVLLFYSGVHSGI